MRRQSYSREQWLSWISEQASSGLSIAGFESSKGATHLLTGRVRFGRFWEFDVYPGG